MYLICPTNTERLLKNISLVLIIATIWAQKSHASKVRVYKAVIYEQVDQVSSHSVSEAIGSLLKPFKGLTEKAMAPHSSTPAWEIPWTEEPGRLRFMGSLRVRHDWVTSLSLFTFLHWRRKWQPTPVFLPGESQGRGSLVGCHLWGHTESDTTEVT